MLNTSSRSSIAALTNAVQSMPYAPSAKDSTQKTEFWDNNDPTHQVLAEIQKRDASQANAGWITMDEIRQHTGLSQTDVVSGLRELFHHQTIESIVGNGQGNHRYRLIKLASLDYLDRPEIEAVQALKAAVAQEPKMQIKKIEPILLAAAETSPAPVMPPVAAQAKQEAEKIEEGLPRPKTSQESAAMPTTPAAQKRDAKGHFLPMAGKPKRRSRAKAKAKNAKASGKLVVQPKRQKSVVPPTATSSTDFQHHVQPLPGENRIKRARESGGLMVLTLERRPGGPSVSISLDDAIVLGQQALNEKLKLRAATHH